MHFICGVNNAEDLVLIPRSEWIIGSGLAAPDQPGSGGLVLINAQTHVATKATLKIAGELSSPFTRCPGPLDPAAFSAHGLNIRETAPGRSRLFVVGHGGREATEIFDVTSRANAMPTIEWVGCIPAPPNNSYMNAVVGLHDGTIISTQFLSGTAKLQDIFKGKVTGAVYIWRPGGNYEMLHGTELAGANGVEITPDEKQLFVAVTGTGVVLRYDLANMDKPPVSIQTHFRTDNLRWAPDGKLLLAGPAFRGPAFDPSCDPMAGSCGGGVPVVASLDPRSLAVHEIYHGPAEPDFKFISTGLIVGNTLWFGTHTADRIGYVELK